MDKDLFLNSVGYDKTQGQKVNLLESVGLPFQLGCVKNIPTQRYQMRAFCAYLCNGAVPRNPKVHTPRPLDRNRKATTNTRSFYRKFSVRKSYRVNSRKRAFTPCSPQIDLAAKRKNLNDSFHEISLSDF